MALSILSNGLSNNLPLNQASKHESHNDSSSEPISLATSTSHQALVPVNWDTPVEIITLKENEFVFKDGETPKGLYFLKSGSLKTYINRAMARGRMASPEFITKVVGAGEFFGFESLIKGSNYSSNAKTLKPSEIYVYSKEAILSVIRGPNSILKMVLLQAMKDADTHENISQLHYLASVQERIAYQLVLLSDKFGVQTPNGVSLNLRLTRNELAQLAGTINESLSRHLTELKNDGIVDINGKEIIVKNRQALMARSGNFKF